MNRVQTGPASFENLRLRIGEAHRHTFSGSFVTSWLHQRIVPGVLPHATAYAGALMKDSDGTSLGRSMRDFAREYFGSDSRTVPLAIARLCGLESSLQDLSTSFAYDSLHVAARLRSEQRDRDMSFAARVSGTASMLRNARETITRNRREYDSYVLLADLLEYLASRRQSHAGIR